MCVCLSRMIPALQIDLPPLIPLEPSRNVIPDWIPIALVQTNRKERVRGLQVSVSAQ